MNLSSAQSPAEIQLKRSIDLPWLPSGSGMAYFSNTLYIVGDDSPYLFALDSDYKLNQKALLLEKYAGVERIPKAAKPDFESIAEEHTEGGNFLFIFGSGSKSPERDLLIRLNPKSPEKATHYSLSAFYNVLAQLNKDGRESINLEGAFIREGILYLLNRAGNQLILLPLSEFKEYLNGNRAAADLALSIHQLKLPVKGEVKAGISGATSIPGSSFMYFTATLEDTPNWIEDGEILGSYIGVLDLRKLKEVEQPKISLLLNQQGTVLQDKLESIVFSRYTREGNMEFIAIADNDKGNSRLFELVIDKNFLPD